MVTPLYSDHEKLAVPYVTIGLILTNLIVFLYECTLTTPELINLFRHWGNKPHYLYYGDFSYFLVTVFTGMFLHADWSHFIGNMLFLWIFGGTIEGHLGHTRFTVLYVLAGWFGGLVTFIFFPAGMIPSIGASGAIAGIMAAFLILAPLANLRVVMFFFFIPVTFDIPAWAAIGTWFLMNLLNGYVMTGGEMRGGVGWLAHLGGFTAGIILTFFYQILSMGRANKGALLDHA